MRSVHLLFLLVGCGPGKGKIGEDLDTEARRERPAAATCASNCQSVDWVERDAALALADIAVCLEEPAYAPADVTGAITIHFRDVPCREAVARVAAAAGLKALLSTVNGQRVMLLHRHPGEKLVLLEREGGGASTGGRRAPAGSCLEGCAAELRSCKASCGWHDSRCIRSCEDRYRRCNQAC